MRGTGFLSVFFFVLIFFAACHAPIQRKDPNAAADAPVATVKDPTEIKTPDLKKRIWVLSFRPIAKVPESLKDLDVPKILQQKMINTLNNDKESLFIPQTPEDQLAFGNVELTSNMEARAVGRVLRGSDISGFLTGEISRLDVKEIGGDQEGILKSKTVQFNFSIKYELYDMVTARRLGGGTENQSYTETRSDIFGSYTEIPELDRRMGEMAEKHAKAVLEKLRPFAEKLAWSGRILRMDGTRAYLNAGRRTGIFVGDVLKVVEGPREIVDPQSGDVVGDAPGRIKGTLKIIQYFGGDSAVGVLQSGGGIQTGDRVELY